MLHYALVFLVIAIVAGVLGFGGIAGASVGIAKVLFLVFIVLFVLSCCWANARVLVAARRASSGVQRRNIRRGRALPLRVAGRALLAALRIRGAGAHRLGSLIAS